MSNLIAPLRRPQEFGFKKGDHHLVVNAATKLAKCWAHSGLVIWEAPCLADGQHPNWKANSGDTPPGLYRIGDVYSDYRINGANPAYDRNLASYGWASFDMVDLEGNEDRNGREGIMLHGGGSTNGWPGAWAPRQPLRATLGCLRMHNEDLRDKVLPLTRSGTVFISVHQDDV
jgi:hypothetical protein